jgi:UDP-N-acetylmuramoylalanine--D-glutamate ligase
MYSERMVDCRALFGGKRITLLGLGLLGRGVGDAEFLAQCGAHVLVTDKKSEAELAEPVARLKKYPNVDFHLGGHRLEDFTGCDMVIKAAGVRLDSPEVAAARAAGVPVMMSTALFAKHAVEVGAKLVGVTGTRGKSTTSHLIHHSLIRANRRTMLGGNVRGLSTLAMLPDVKAGDVAVLELDSWQLQGFGELHLSPHVAVFSNLMPDHQNYYKDMDEYFADKANIFRYQRAGDTLVVGPAIEAQVRAAHPPVEPLVPHLLASDWVLNIPGEHNRHNAALAAAALLSLGLNSEEIRAGLESFEGVEGRLQLVYDRNGVRIYNDNNATTPEATIAALRALGTGVALIAGGSDKGLELDELVAEIKLRTSHVFLLEHDNYKGSTRLAESLSAAAVPYIGQPSLEQALAAALATKCDIVLFSPAFASFGMFKNEYERNDAFMKLVSALP